MGTSQGARTYQYDARNQLTEICFQASCTQPADPYITYTYDAVGNRTTEVRPSGTTTYEYDAGDQLLSRSGPAGTVKYAYDADGNQSAIGARTFTYDVANRVKSTSSGNSTITYSYDGDGKRIEVSAGKSSTTKYLWDANHPLPELALERTGKDALIRRYVYGSDLVSMNSGGSEYFYHYDGIGSVVGLSSATGVAQWAYDYEPFGQLRAEQKLQTKAPANPMRFTGELFDMDTGLYHLRARQYDPGQGRFLAQDPLAPPLTDPFVASYVYARNQPTFAVDPSGLRDWRNWVEWPVVNWQGWDEVGNEFEVERSR